METPGAGDAAARAWLSSGPSSPTSRSWPATPLLLVFPLCVLLVFLVLAAQYESWSLPLAVILIVPMCLLAAMAGVWLTEGDNNIFTQIGFVVLVGSGLQERDPDRGVRPGAASPGPQHPSTRRWRRAACGCGRS